MLLPLARPIGRVFSLITRRTGEMGGGGCPTSHFFFVSVSNDMQIIFLSHSHSPFAFFFSRIIIIIGTLPSVACLSVSFTGDMSSSSLYCYYPFDLFTASLDLILKWRSLPVGSYVHPSVRSCVCVHYASARRDIRSREMPWTAPVVSCLHNRKTHCFIIDWDKLRNILFPWLDHDDDALCRFFSSSWLASGWHWSPRLVADLKSKTKPVDRILIIRFALFIHRWQHLLSLFFNFFFIFYFRCWLVTCYEL